MSVSVDIKIKINRINNCLIFFYLVALNPTNLICQEIKNSIFFSENEFPENVDDQYAKHFTLF